MLGGSDQGPQVVAVACAGDRPGFGDGGVPSVRVPVLSNAIRVAAPSCSITTADLTSTPCRPAFAMANSSGGMVASTTAHGDATMMNVMARSSVGCSSAQNARGAANRATAAATTPTECRCSIRSMNSWAPP